ncbi:acyl-homoserine-lactone synthase [Amaricoccus solimangrovi]|uniref:Autoinducer synthase n=1 Tax=Amaricoccus solimangrovi TaxID=2589815 RepID=A0A501WWT8_9RHOB|nr:acyl-homoserine-lactone synthase [Amaricoccus solimangrovi]TPE53739.1 autoinducer synthase [Amaricoccus solimangrovi]
MRNITFAFLDQHRHGAAFHDFLRLRKSFFVDELGWDIPHDDEVEMDQYDNPLAHYSLVLRGGAVIGGARCMPTTARWGNHTYMLRDALRGGLRHIPPEVMPADIATPEVWECTRLVMSHDVAGHAERATCLSLIVDGLVRVARSRGAEALVSLSPLPLMRGLRQLGFDAQRLGEPYLNENDGRKYAVLQMSATPAPEQLMAAE